MMPRAKKPAAPKLTAKETKAFEGVRERAMQLAGVCLAPNGSETWAIEYATRVQELAHSLLDAPPPKAHLERSQRTMQTLAEERRKRLEK